MHEALSPPRSVPADAPRILEPGAGVGSFHGIHAPEGYRFIGARTGQHLRGRIAKAWLHPQVTTSASKTSAIPACPNSMR